MDLVSNKIFLSELERRPVFLDIVLAILGVE